MSVYLYDVLYDDSVWFGIWAFSLQDLGFSLQDLGLSLQDLLFSLQSCFYGTEIETMNCSKF